jgi:FkbM family methyltransferase
LERRLRPSRLALDRLTRLDGDLHVWVRLVDDIERNVFLLGVYDHSAARAFERLVPTGGTALDVGAHVGQFSLLAARASGRNGRVLAFEPQPYIRERLERNIQANGFSNITVLPLALSDTKGRRLFHTTDDDTNSGLAALCATPTTCTDAHITVDTDTLDHVLADEDVTTVHAVKLDVEGGEASVLSGAQGMLKSQRPAVLFEANDIAVQGALVSPTVTILRRFGYSFFIAGRADGDGPNLFPCNRAEQLTASTRPYRPRNLIALHPDSQPMENARRWIRPSSAHGTSDASET